MPLQHLNLATQAGTSTSSTAVGIGVASGVIVKANTSLPLVKVDIAAAQLTVQNASLSSVSVSADITVVGAGGLRSGETEAASTWYAVYVISNDDGTLVNGLLSTSATPSLPSGYTNYRRVSWVRNNASSNFVAMTRFGDRVYIDDPNVFTQTFSGNQTTNGNISFATAIPTTSRIGMFAGSASINMTSTASGSAHSSSLSIRSNASYAYWSTVVAVTYNPTTGSLGVGQAQWEYMLTASQQVDTSIAISTAESGSASFMPIGYYDPI